MGCVNKPQHMVTVQRRANSTPEVPIIYLTFDKLSTRYSSKCSLPLSTHCWSSQHHHLYEHSVLITEFRIVFYRQQLYSNSISSRAAKRQISIVAGYCYLCFTLMFDQFNPRSSFPTDVSPSADYSPKSMGVVMLARCLIACNGLRSAVSILSILLWHSCIGISPERFDWVTLQV